MKTPTIEADLSESTSKETTLKKVSLESKSADAESPASEEILLEDLSQQIRLAVDQLAVSDFQGRWDAAKQFTAQFSEWGDRAIDPLIEQLQHQEDPDVQWFLVRILSQFEHPATVAALAELLVHTTNEELQQAVSKALSGMGAIAIETLSQLLHPETAAATDIDNQETGSTKRILAARTLAYIRRGAVVEPLLEVVDDSNTELRAIAIEALASFHDPRITPVLINALNDQPPICIEAIRTLGRRRDLLPTTDLVGPLQQCLRSGDEAIARESAMALGRLGCDEAVSALGEQLAQPLPTGVKCAISEALGWLNLPAAVTYLADSFQQSEPFIAAGVRPSIAKALGQTRREELKLQAAKPMIAWLNAHHDDAHSAPQEMSNSTPHRTALAQSILLSLARLGVQSAISSIVPMLAHPDSRLRMHALSALKQIDPRESQQFTQRYLERADISAAMKQSMQQTLSAW